MQWKRFSTQQTITLGAELGGGGEGKVYKISQDSSLVAKVYHTHKVSNELGNKLEVMFGNPPHDPSVNGHKSIAWPVDLLLPTNGNHQVIGFLMPCVTQAHPIHKFYTPSDRLQHSPLFNYLYLHRTARNLAAAISALHKRDYVVGDVNESNILVTDTALVTLVDTDSFQVWDKTNNVVYRCPVGKPEFTPPELQGQRFSDVNRMAEHDLFGLGVLIFQLLMEGTHPFDGVFQGNGEAPVREKRIQSGHFPYGNKSVPYKPKRAAPPFNILHPDLQQLFVRCFEDGHHQLQIRPDAQTWVKALDVAENKLVTCAVNDQHRYGGHLQNCPWCERTALLGGNDPFPANQMAQKPLPKPGQNIPFSPVQKTTPPPQPTPSPSRVQPTPFAPQSPSFTSKSATPKFLLPRWALGIGISLAAVTGFIYFNPLGQHGNINSSTPSADIVTSPQYEKLRDLLAAGNWKDADLETTSLMLKIAGREKEGYFDYNSLRNFPKAPLRTIDQLWLKYSNGRFGFSVQKKIWLDKGGKFDDKYDYNTYAKLGDAVGWKKGGEWLSYSDFTFNTDAPAGHLPAVVTMGGEWSGVGGGRVGRGLLFSLL